MADLKKILEEIAKSIVDAPDAVEVIEEAGEEEDEVLLTLHVAPEDMGKVIGKQGRIARAIRLVLRAAAAASDRRVDVEIRD